jgi:hypothetical protein
MGSKGRERVTKQTLSHVAADMVGWYKVGIQRREERSHFRAAMVAAVLAAAVPILIFAHWVYELVVRSIMIRCNHRFVMELY